jgi:hypothetical protein
MKMELGKAKYGSGKETFKIKDGDNVFRILPPMGQLAKKGFWNTYYRVEWGYKNSEGRNRPFQDVRDVDYKTKMVNVESAAHLRREALKAEKESLVAQFRKDPKNEALKTKLIDVTEAIKRYNLDSKYYLNAVSLDGKIGLLKLGSRAFKALKEEIEKLRKSGVDPLSVENGRFFNFHRSNATGNFQDTAYQVTVYKTAVVVNGETYEKAPVHVMDDAFISRLSDEAFELSGMFPKVTPEQVSQMVAEGASAVDRILGVGDSRSAGDDESSDEETTSSTPVAKAAPVAAAAPITKTEVAAASASTPVAAAPAASTSGDLSNDEFLKSIGAL